MYTKVKNNKSKFRNFNSCSYRYLFLNTKSCLKKATCEDNIKIIIIICSCSVKDIDIHSNSNI